MNGWIVLHWLAYFGVVAFAVSLVVYVCRELAARWRIDVDDALRFMSGYSFCNALWFLSDGHFARASVTFALTVVCWLVSRK